MNDDLILRAGKVKRKKKFVRTIKIILTVLLLLLLLMYIVVGIVYNGGNFSITLDKNLYLKNNIVIYDDSNYKVFRTELYAKTLDKLDNISYKWLPNDLDSSDGGSHNGDNYVAYTFFIENMGDMTSDYWSQIVIDDSIKNLDEAIRIRVYKNGEYVTYAKLGIDGNPEKDTVAFLDGDDAVARDHVESFMPGDINKYTIVIWLEGTDPECTDNILGGEIKIHMEFNSEFIDEESNSEEN
ncbi:MAG: hypothetical protein PHD02_02035 [Bacilli bacterium]|nr:hypothetical protein [Bacilli bacterium]